MFKNKTFRWAVIFLVLIGLGAAAYYFYFTPQTAAAEAAPLQTARARKGDISITINGAGNLIASTRVELGFRSGGTLVSVPAQVGVPVATGEAGMWRALLAKGMVGFWRCCPRFWSARLAVQNTLGRLSKG